LDKSGAHSGERFISTMIILNSRRCGRTTGRGWT